MRIKNMEKHFECTIMEKCECNKLVALEGVAAEDDLDVAVLRAQVEVSVREAAAVLGLAVDRPLLLEPIG